MVAPRQNERLYDIRTVRRNVRSGLITKERYEEWLKTLPDASDNAVPLTLEDEGHRRRDAAGVTSPTRKMISAPFDDDEDEDEDDFDDEDDLEDEDEDEEIAETAAAPEGETSDAGDADAGDADASDAAAATGEAAGDPDAADKD